MSQTVAELLVNALERIGVRHIFGLIGDSLNPLADAVRRTGIEWVGVRHEEGGALAAAGQAKLTGQLGVCCGTTGPGSTHLVAGLYEAARDHAPVLAISGDMPRKMHGPHWIGGIGMIGTKASYNAAVDCELFLMVGTDYPYSEFLPRKGVVAQIDDRAEVLGRRAPTALGVFGSVRPSIKLLLDRVSTKSDTRFWDQVNAERRKWDAMLDKQADPNRSKDRIHPQAVARTVSDLAKRDSVFVFDTGLNTLWSANWLRQTGSQRIIGSFNNAAVGTALAQANGVQVLDRSRQVIALCGDGGFNMLMSEFLTAVHHKLPVKAVVYNNSAFGLITLEAESIGLAAYREGIEFPNPDYVALANACGGQGFRAARPGDLRAAIGQALAADGPAIIDCVVASNEMPNFPHLELDKIGNYAVAKIKEAMLAFCGR